MSNQSIGIRREIMTTRQQMQHQILHRSLSKVHETNATLTASQLFTPRSSNLGSLGKAKSAPREWMSHEMCGAIPNVDFLEAVGLGFRMMTSFIG